MHADHSLLFCCQANLMTGAINLSMRTLCASDPLATCIIFTYMVAVCVAALALHMHNITLKAW